MNLSIVPLNIGTIYTDNSLVTPRKNYGNEFACPVIVWYIQGSSKKILIDTGFKDTISSSEIHSPQKIERKPEQEIQTALGRIGVRAADIDIVILTHLHWDHCQNTDLFVNAKFVVQRAEMQYAICPLPSHKRLYESITAGLYPLWLNTKNWQVINGDTEIVEGVKVILTPGHSPGFQSVLIKTLKGVYAIASDNVTVFENWGDLESGTHVPGGTYVNLEDYWRSIARLENEADVILPGHDPNVFKQESYP